MPYKTVEYIENGKSPFAEWFNGLDPVAAARVDRYIRRMESGNFGAAKRLREGVLELRLDIGPGYRVYFALAYKNVVVILGGGDKKRQSSDIAIAVERWRCLKRRGGCDGLNERV